MHQLVIVDLKKVPFFADYHLVDNGTITRIVIDMIQVAKHTINPL